MNAGVATRNDLGDDPMNALQAYGLHGTQTPAVPAIHVEYAGHVGCAGCRHHYRRCVELENMLGQAEFQAARSLAGALEERSRADRLEIEVRQLREEVRSLTGQV